MKNIAISLTVASLILFSGALSARQTSTISLEYPSISRGIRPLGMGNAFVAMKGIDYNAPFYNPAAINDYEKRPHFRFLSSSFDISTGLVGFVKDVIDLGGDINDAGTDGAKVNVFSTFVDQHIGQFESVGINFPLLTVEQKWFHVALLADSRTTFSLRNRSFVNIEMLSLSDMGGVVGGAYGFFEDESIGGPILQVGANLKFLYRLSIDEVITSSDIISTDGFADVIPRRWAFGVGGDIGLKGQIPYFGIKALEILKPAVGLTWQDIGNTRFRNNNVPDNIQSVTLGLALQPTFGPEDEWQANFAFDVREINQASTFPKKMCIGAELQFPELAGFFRPAIRIGANQLYIAAGATLDMKYVRLEFATYGQEASPNSRQKELRRMAFNLNFRV